MHFWKLHVAFLGVMLVGLGIFFTSTKPTYASAPLDSTFAATVSTSAVGTIRQLRVDPANNDVYILGSATSTLGLLSADGSSFTSINYNVGLPITVGSDIAVYNDQAFIVINTGATANAIYRYDISGSVANFVASSSLATGASAITLTSNSNTMHVSKGLTLYTLDTNLNSLASTVSLTSSAARLAYGGGELFYLSNTGRFMRGFSVFETTIATGGPTGSNIKGLVASNDGNALYYASNSTLGKLSVADGTILWTKSISNLSAIDVNTSTGRITAINSSGTVTTYSPINPVSNLSSSASGTSAILNWTTDVSDNDFRGVTIQRSLSGYPTSINEGETVTSSAMGTSFTDTDLSEGTYYYSFFNQTIDGYYSTAATSSITIDLPPAAPVLVAQAISNTIQLVWSVPADTANFVIRRSTSAFPTTYTDGTAVTTTASNITSLTETDMPDGTYYYSIFAADAGGNHSAAGTSSISIDTTPPSTPTLSAAVSGYTATLSWDTPLTTFSFLLRRSTSSFPTSISDGISVTSTVANSFTDVGLSDGTHYYSIFARDTYGNYSNAGTASINVDTTATNAPTSFSAVASSNTINLTWSNPVDTDFASSTIRRSTTDFPNSITDGAAVTSTATTSYTDPSLADGTYYYSIFALDATGNISARATANTTVSTYIPSAAPAASGGGGTGSTPVTPSSISTAPLNFSVSNGSPAGITTTVTSPIISLKLNADPRTVRGYAASLDPEFKNASILPINTAGEMAFPLPHKAGRYTVYLKYYSITGESSKVYTQTVTYTPTQTPSFIGSQNADSPSIFTRLLQQVNQGADIKELQMFLNKPGFIDVKKEMIIFGESVMRLIQGIGYRGKTT